jgi:SAM-dependent methyltransferase
MDDFYYNSKKNVLDYIKMAEPYNGQILIDRLQKHLQRGSCILELGMGPGKDLDMLKKMYKVTGSEMSKVFLDLYREKNPDADLLLLDARYPETNRTFDCVYSNKVLHHLSRNELRRSLQKQIDILNPGGLVMHSFWEGDREEVLSGLTFVYYPLSSLEEIFSECFEIIEIETYDEMFPGDSVWVLGRKRD